MKYRYEVIWTSDDESIPTHHHTFVELSKQSMYFALCKFSRMYYKVLRGSSPYVVVQCNFLGCVIEKCW